MKQYPFRQIHLDFHTSQYIEGIGKDFDADEFAKTLKDANVNAINLFAKGHHGYFYYPTKVGTMHPNLDFDLLSAQIDACKRNDIRANVYLSVGIDEYQSDLHPDWNIKTTEGYSTMGQIAGKGMAKANPMINKEMMVQYAGSLGLWRFMCVNNPGYRKQILSELKEILERFNPPGLWLDIYNNSHCACEHCAKEMTEMGMDASSDAEVLAHGRMVEIEFFKEVMEIAKAHNPDIDIYHNGFGQKADLANDEKLTVKNKVDYNTVLDIESLPSFLWAYNHYPLAVQYWNKKYEDKPITMMSGKFHRIWGDFGSIKNLEAMEYECFRALTYGSRISLGDQLLPQGKLEKTIYEQIGRVFKEIKSKEPWCEGTKKVSEIGVYLSNKALTGIRQSTKGALRILTELSYQFDFIDYESDITEYKLIILPDDVVITDNVKEKIQKYIENGGKVLLTNKSGFVEGEKDFALEEFGVKYLGDAEFAPRYAHIDGFGEINPMDYVMYERGVNVEAKGAEILAYITEPYFNRTPKAFCSHFQTPPKTQPSNKPLVVKNDSVCYIANPLFSDYEKYGTKVYKQIIDTCIKELYAEKLVDTQMPTTAIVTLRENNESYILHVLNYIIQKKCDDMEIIEDKFPLYDKKIRVKCESKPQKIQLVPSIEHLEFDYKDGYAEFVVPLIDGHQMIEIVKG